jgi:hypothetical protein
MKNMSTPPSGKTVLSNWKVGITIGIACLTGLVAIIGYGNGPTGTLSKFSQNRITAKTAASLWTADTTSEHRKRLPADYAPRVDSIVVAILRKWTNLQNDAFRTYLTQLNSWIRALGSKPAYAENEEISSIINYLAEEIGSTAKALDTTGELIDDIEKIVSGGGKICPPLSPIPNTPEYCRYSLMKNRTTGCDEYILACEDANPSKCTQEYKPVCAQLPMPICPEGMVCTHVMPQPKTYSNTCMANTESASILYNGECKQ